VQNWDGFSKACWRFGRIRFGVPEFARLAKEAALAGEELRKAKTVPAPASSRAALLAAADKKALDEARSRRDESLANVKRRQDAAMAKK